MKSPFKFLHAFTLADKDVFFGREEEVAALYGMVAKNRLVLVYGQSGTGKTSLIQCGLAGKYDPTDWYPIFIRRVNNINRSLEEAIAKPLDGSVAGTLTENIEELFANYLRPIYLIFDQLEELFILGKKDEQDAFIQTIADILAANLPVRILFVNREEYLGHLYDFEKKVPTLFDRRLRVEPMTYTNVEKVITNSCDRFKISLEDRQANPARIIDNISAGKSGIQLPYLQVYLDTLWQLASRGNGSITLTDYPPVTFTDEGIQKVGKIEEVLAVFLERQSADIQRKAKARFPVAPDNLVRQLLDGFASYDGTKIPLKWENITVEGTSSSEIINFCLERLEKARLLRLEDQVYELAHDSLAALIDQTRSDEQRLLNEAHSRLTSNYREFLKTGEHLSRKQLNSIEEYLPNLRLETHLLQFVEESYEWAERMEEEEKERQQRELELAQQKLAAEQQKVAAIEKARRRQKVFSIIIFFVALVAVGLGIWANGQQKKAEAALDDVRKKEAERDKLDFENMKRKVYVFLLAGENELARAEYDSMKALINKDTFNQTRHLSLDSLTWHLDKSTE